MSVTYPLALPSCVTESLAFELERQESIAPEQGGRLVSIELGPALWRASYAMQPRNERDFDLWRGFISSLRGSSKLFYGRDVRRKWPRAYRGVGFTDLTRAGGGAFDGTATSFELNGARDEIDLTGLPAGFEIAIGDYLDFRWDTWKRSLHRIVTDLNADGSGEGTWTLEPRVETVVPDDAVVNFTAPCCTMALLPGSVDVRAESGRQRRVSFDAKQHLEE